MGPHQHGHTSESARTLHTSTGHHHRRCQQQQHQDGHTDGNWEKPGTIWKGRESGGSPAGKPLA